MSDTRQRLATTRGSIPSFPRSGPGEAVDSKRAFQFLVDHQARVAELLDRSKASLAPDQPADFVAIAAIRWNLMRVLRAYQLFKHQEIFDPLARSGDDAIASEAEVMKQRCVAVGVAYITHADRWSHGAAISEWDAYVTEASKMIGRIERHLARERTEVEMLFRNVGRTRAHQPKP